MRKAFSISTHEREALYDITKEVEDIVAKSGVKEGLCHVYVKHATAAIMIQENWDDSVQRDVIALLRKLIPQGTWEHDRQDGNGDSHLKAGIIGPSETLPVKDSALVKGTWQNLFLCEFDGPREAREILVTVQ